MTPLSRPAATLLLGLLTACATTPPPLLTATELERAILSWLDCDECYNGQFEYLVSLGDQARPRLSDYADPATVAQILEPRRKRYFDRVEPIVAAQLGVDLAHATARQRNLVEERANHLATFYVSGDELRYLTRARHALDQLSGAAPEAGEP